MAGQVAEFPAPGEDGHDQVLQQREQPPLDQHQAAAEPLPAALA
jgi:hypothetical protein